MTRIKYTLSLSRVQDAENRGLGDTERGFTTSPLHRFSVSNPTEAEVYG